MKNKINESPDLVNIEDDVIISWDKNDTIPFGIINDEMYIGYSPRFASRELKNRFINFLVDIEDKDIDFTIGNPHTHEDISEFYNFLNGNYHHDDALPFWDRNSFDYSGRIWINHYIISFWKYPEDKQKLYHVLNKLKKEIYRVYKLNIDINHYSIDIGDDKPLVLPKNYGNGGEWSDEEMAKQHLLPSEIKKYSPQMKAYRDADIKFKGKKYGKMPIVKYNFHKNKGIDENNGVLNIITEEIKSLEKMKLIDDWYKEKNKEIWNNEKYTIKQREKLAQQLIIKKQSLINRYVEKKNQFGWEGNENAKYIYHFTTGDSLIGILSDNIIYGFPDGISFTTNGNLYKRKFVFWYGKNNKDYSNVGVRIKLDYHKMKNDGLKFKLGDESIGTTWGEEEIRLLKTELENPFKYVVEIAIFKDKESKYEALVNYLEKKNINFKVF